jgi:2-methylcitrate dehydratase PrpD
MTLTQLLSQWIKRTDFSNFDDATVKQAKLHILDALGAGLYGSSMGLFEKLWPLYQAETQYTTEATLFGNGCRISNHSAAFLNSISINESNVEDGHRHAACHPSASVIPASFAVAEKGNLSGDKLITAVICGYEVMCRIGHAINPSHLRRGFHTTATVAPFGAAASAAKLCDLDASAMRNAFGLAAAFSSGLMESFSTDARPLQVGRGCQSGLLAVELAQQAVSGPPAALEGKEGFFRVLSDESDSEAVRNITSSTGYEVTKSYIKVNGGCRHLHAAMDAIMMLVKIHNIVPADIQKIEIGTYPVAMDFVGVMEPKNGKEAEFSLPFAIAVAVLDGKAAPRDFSDRKVADNRVKTMMQKVTIDVSAEVADAYPEKRGTIVGITTGKDKYTKKLDYAKGEPEFPATKSEIVDKFKSLAAKILPSQRVDKIVELSEKIENISDIGELTSLFKRSQT